MVRGVVLTEDRGFKNKSRVESKLARDILDYFEGKEVDFGGYAVDMSGYTPFEAKVLEAVRSVPYGKVKTYREVAKMVGKPTHARAVAYTLSKNRACIVIPCHRIVESKSELGDFVSGIEWKKNLLELEGAI